MKRRWLVAAALALGMPATETAWAEALRMSLGPAVALDPAFAALSAGVDWFVAPACALGVLASQTIPKAGDQLALEDGYGFATALARYRPRAEGRMHLEMLVGAGLARTRLGTPGAHTEWAPDVAAGAALGLTLGGRWELAGELTAHVTIGDRTATRNVPHTSELLGVVLRWGGP